MSTPTPKNKKTATSVHPTINAVLKELYRFANEEQALSRIRQLKEHFVASKLSAEKPNTAVLWIRGYALTPEESKQGYTGNYAIISAKKQGGKYVLAATKLATELGVHPQRKRPKKQHPDWGHPILRDIKKKRNYDSAAEAAHELSRLHEEFPEASIPDEGRLMIILYEKTEGRKSPVQKYKFAVRAVPEGGFIIEYQKNVKPIKSQLPGSKAAPLPKDAESSYFTEMVKLKRKKKPTPPKGA